MRVELTNKNPGNTNKDQPNAAYKSVADIKDNLKNIVEKEDEKKKVPLFYTIPIFRPNKYEFY